MKYLKQLSIIFAICFVAEILYMLLPLPVPASIYGLLILFMLLLFRVVKPEQVEDVAEFFLAIMPFFFISPSVSLMKSFVSYQDSVLSVLVIGIVSTLVVTVSTGITAQFFIRRKKKKDDEKVEAS